MNRNILKYIAIIAMTIDHIGSYIEIIPLEIALLLKIIGRITMPIMCLFIAEGFLYTKNKSKYALRLFLLATISQFIWCLAKHNTLMTWELFLDYNTVFTLLAGFLLLWVIECDMKLIYKAIFIILITSFSFMCDYNIVGLIYVLFFYLFKDNKYKLLYLSILYLISPIILGIGNDFGLVQHLVNSLVNIGLFLTIPLIYLYNGKSGNKNIFNKYFFYVYYPSHLLVLFIINLYL